ncbi:MAG: glycosyl hydrolase [Opitutaceae bacterium]
MNGPLRFCLHWALLWVCLSQAKALDAPVSPDAIPEVGALLDFLESVRGKYVLSGQQETVDWFGTGNNPEFPYILDKTGQVPAVRGFDFMFMSDDRNTTQRVGERAIEWSEAGGIVTICFHWFAGRPREAFYTNSTDFNLIEALKAGTRDNEEFIREMDEVAEELKKLRDAGVPVLWRPFHECNGGWFWWGAKGPEAFKQAWVFMFDRFVEVHGLTNLVWCYNPTAQSGALEAWYPGDDYVDIISLDTYPPTGTHAPFAAEYQRFRDFRDGRKIVGMSENGSIPDPDEMFRTGAYWAWFCTWNGDFTTDGIVNPVDFLSRVYHHPRVLTRDELQTIRPRLDLPPSIVMPPVAAAVSPGDAVSFGVVASGSPPLAYQWFRDGVEMFGQSAPNLSLGPASVEDAVTYRVRVSNANGSMMSDAVALSVGGEPLPESRLVNLSTRAFAGTRGDAMIAGLVVGGAGAKQLLIRAVGPGLPFSVAGVVEDPVLRLTTPGGTLLASNDDWSSDPDETVRLQEAFAESGAFPLELGSRDAAVLTQVPPGPYTIIVRGVAETVGKVLIEVYDMETGSGARLVNLSTRARVGSGEGVVILGYVVQGGTATDVLIRAVGPTLGEPPFALAGTLADPLLRLRRLDGTILASNAPWDDDPVAADRVNEAGAQVSAFPLLPGKEDAALVFPNASGVLTAVANSPGDGTGITLVEVYEVP